MQLIDEFTGRVSPDKRFSDGLHQALEAKEQVAVRSEDRTLAKTSYQTFFSLYPKLCKMTGTAVKVEEEFSQTYGLRVVAVPTNRPMIRRDQKPAVCQQARQRVVAAGGLAVISTGLHEAQRIDDQLRGRAGGCAITPRASRSPTPRSSTLSKR